MNFRYDYDSFAHMFSGSCADMLKSSFPEGMSEILIAAILWEILQGLDYLHKMGIIHRYILLNSSSISSRTNRLGRSWKHKQIHVLHSI